MGPVTMKKVKLNMIVFWKYDVFPYCLSGVLKEELDDGKVSVEGYPGFKITNLLILPPKHGAEVAKYLKALQKEFEESKKALHTEFMDRATDVAPWLK